MAAIAPAQTNADDSMPSDSAQRKMRRVAHLTSVHDALDGRIFYRECRSLARAGYDVVIVAPGASDRIVDGVRIKAVPKRKSRVGRFLATAPGVCAAALRERCDVYHFHDPELMPWALWLRALGKRVVYDAHEDLPKDISLKRWLPRPLRSPLAFAAKHVSRALSGMLDATVIAVPPIASGVGGRRVVTIYNYPVLDDILQVQPRAWRERSRAAIYEGMITANRGLWEMIGAMQVPQLPAGATLTLAGKFDDPALLHAAQQQPGWKRVDYVGWQEGDALWRLIADAKVGVVTLRPTPTFLDSMPTKLLEYMALGLPVVASDFPAWRKIVAGNDCGILVDPLEPQAVGAAIASLLNNPEQAEAMGKRGREAVLDRFQWNAEAEKLVSLYADLCSAK